MFKIITNFLAKIKELRVKHCKHKFSITGVSYNLKRYIKFNQCRKCGYILEIDSGEDNVLGNYF